MVKKVGNKFVAFSHDGKSIGAFPLKIAAMEAEAKNKIEQFSARCANSATNSLTNI